MSISNSAPILRSIVDRAVRLTEEQRDAAAALKDVMTEAKSKGYDVKALRTVIKHAMETPEQRESRETTEAIIAAMKADLGAFGDTDLGKAAIASALG